MRTVLAFSLLAALLGCGGTEPAAEAPVEQTQQKPSPADERRRFPLENRASFEIVDRELLGKSWLPGGNLAVYENNGKTHKQFLIKTDSPDAAGLLLYEAKGKLTDAKFVASFGGFFGMDGDEPWFLFPKGSYLGGVVGLPQEDADAVARGFAALIP